MNITNSDVATRLDEIAQILEEQHANAFRIEAYRRTATLRGLMSSQIKGVEGLQQLPGVGETLARLIHQLVTNG